MTDKPPPGGRRPGSGRPPKDPAGKQVRLYFSVPPDVAEWLLQLERRSEWLTEAVRRERRRGESGTDSGTSERG